MTLTGKKRNDGENESEGERERPESWERISTDDLPDPDYDEYTLPDPDDLTRVPADEFYES